MKPVVATVAAILLALGTPAPAQGTPVLLRDVETTNPGNPGAFFDDHPAVAWGPYLYFAADAEGFGKELWRSNGAVGNASLVVDLRLDGGSEPEPIGILGGWLLFVADDGVSGRELWRTDGTPAGTSLLKDIAPGAESASPSHFVRYGSFWYYFLVGGALWKTDGQPGNTILVGQTNTDAYELAASASQLWILGDNNGTYELWASDGNTSVYQVRTFTNEPTGLTGLAGINVLFSNDDGSNGRELWKSNGSFAGTTMFLDLAPGSASSYPSEWAAWNGLAWFRANNLLWRSDGTVGGTYSLDGGNGPRFATNLTPAGSHLFFVAQNAAQTNAELWVTDGTNGGTSMVNDTWPGNASSGTSGLGWDGTRWLYFTAHDGTTGYELWRTDRTLTQRVSDIQPGFPDSSPVVLGFANGYCLFSAVWGDRFANELFASQGNGNHLVRDIRTGDNGRSSPDGVRPQVDGRFVFSGTRGALGREAYFSNGTGPGTGFLVDTFSGAQSGMTYSDGASLGIYTFFTSGPNGRLWRTAGTTQSTNQIAGVTLLRGLVEFAGKLYFAGHASATYGQEVYVLDDPLGAPRLLYDMQPGTGGRVDDLTVVGNRLFFVAQDPQGTNLWVTDGTTTGTQRVYVHGLWGQPFRLRAFGRRLLFRIADTLVICDGTAAGTQTIGNLLDERDSAVVGDRMFLAAELPGTGLELCVTDGITVSLVKDIKPGAAASNVYGLTAFGNGVLFIADDGTHGYELWKSDGTAAGTQMVVDLRPGRASGCLPHDWSSTETAGFVFAPRGAQRALFLADDGTGGAELWRTDGTAAGTVRHADIQPGPLGSWPSRPTRCGAQLVFAATQTEFPAPAVGRELFAMPAMALAEPFGSPCAVSLALAPLASGVGTPFLGNPGFALRVNAAPNAVCAVAIGTPTDLSLSPCELRVANFAPPFVAVANGAGDAQFGVPVPNSLSLTGARLAAQWVVLQSGGPFLGSLALSNGVDLVLQTQ